MDKEFTKYVVQYKSSRCRAWIDAPDGNYSCLKAAKKDITYRKKCYPDVIYRVIQRNWTVEERVLEE
jgi:hypothetical protein